MRDEYDFTNAIKNPYAKKLRKPVTIRLSVDAIEYFKDMAASTGIAYQNLINIYLLDCMEKKKQIDISWR